MMSSNSFNYFKNFVSNLPASNQAAFIGGL